MNECSCQSECNLNDFTSANMARSEYKRFKMCYTKHLCLLNINFAPITPVTVSKFISTLVLHRNYEGENYTVIFFYPGMFRAFFFTRCFNFDLSHS